MENGPAFDLPGVSWLEEVVLKFLQSHCGSGATVQVGRDVEGCDGGRPGVLV